MCVVTHRAAAGKVDVQFSEPPQRTETRNPERQRSEGYSRLRIHAIGAPPMPTGADLQGNAVPEF